MQNPKQQMTILSYGNIIEWYDYSLYAIFASQIASDFFPSDNRYISILFAFATFFFGSLVRPLGGLLMGWLGDKISRNWVVNICIIAAGVATVSVAFLPTYQTIGIAAPLILILLRLVQGISAGGQFPGLITIAVNHFSSHRGFVVGLIFSISSLGFVLASLIGYFMTEIISGDIGTLVWRVPFGLGGVLLVLYLYLRQRYDITEIAEAKPKRKSENVFISLLKQWEALIGVTCLTTMMASLYYFIFTYLINYRIETLHDQLGSSFMINTLALIAACLLYPFFGYFADRIGYKRIFFFCTLAMIILSVPLFMLFKTQGVWMALVVLLIFTVFMTAIQGAISPLFALTFDQEWMATGCALAFSIGNGLAGGAPMFAELITHNVNYGLSIYVILLSLIGLVGMGLILHLSSVKAQTNASDQTF